MAIPDATDFLRSVSGYAKATTAPSPGVRLGVVDPAYVSSTYPSTLPKVTFDGESTLSGKRYPVVGPYWPAASDRVALIPTGNTYAIIGALESDAGIRVSSGQRIDSGGWTSYTPTWTATVTNPTIVAGAGSYAGYRYADKNTVQVSIITNIAAGSSKGSGIYSISLPVASADSSLYGAVGGVVINDSGAAVRLGLASSEGYASSVRVYMATTGAQLSDATLTGTFVGSWFKMSLLYQI